MNNVDKTYLSLVEDVLTNGKLKPTRAKIDGKNVNAYTVYGRQARYSLQEGFPILTTKRINFNAIVHELLWFLRGESNIQYLRDNNVHIWDAWADSSGELGYGTYGTLWRKFPYYKECQDSFEWNSSEHFFESESNHERVAIGTVDQIKELLNNIEKVKLDPTASCGRRLIVTAWHPYYVDKVGLPPCHCFMQFHVDGDFLTCHLYQRSCDLFLGVPFNISSYALLTHIVAYQTGLLANEFIHTYGDLHVYENHIEQLRQQSSREPYKLPTLSIAWNVKSIDSFIRDDFKLIDYKCHSSLRGEVAI